MKKGGKTIWNPTASEFFAAMVAILTMPQQQPDAISIHGSTVRSPELDENFCKAVLNIYTPNTKIIINGLTAKQCKERNVAYRGCEIWKEMLSGHINESDIITIPASLHTGAEARNLLLLAKENSWQRLTIASYPHHILRCYLSIISMMSEVNYMLNVNPITFKGIALGQELIKPIITGNNSFETGSFADHIQGEFERIIMYAQEPEIKDGKPMFTRNATIPEMFEYINNLNTLNKSTF